MKLRPTDVKMAIMRGASFGSTTFTFIVDKKSIWVWDIIPPAHGWCLMIIIK
jgi:hypothetical protein